MEATVAVLARITVGGFTYYTRSSFGNVAATVNVGRPSTDSTRINGVPARLQAYTTGDGADGRKFISRWAWTDAGDL
ncbi:MAG: hypothetical protein EOP49_33040 [Sphingobacteriales bacterium]|nr:MAG: hypothetical protein EOP49_33040 [Sphingobacteriales bacterium]